MGKLSEYPNADSPGYILGDVMRIARNNESCEANQAPKPVVSKLVFCPVFLFFGQEEANTNPLSSHFWQGVFFSQISFQHLNSSFCPQIILSK